MTTGGHYIIMLLADCIASAWQQRWWVFSSVHVISTCPARAHLVLCPCSPLMGKTNHSMYVHTLWVMGLLGCFSCPASQHLLCICALWPVHVIFRALCTWYSVPCARDIPCPVHVIFRALCTWYSVPCACDIVSLVPSPQPSFSSLTVHGRAWERA